MYDVDPSGALVVVSNDPHHHDQSIHSSLGPAERTQTREHKVYIDEPALHFSAQIKTPETVSASTLDPSSSPYSLLPPASFSFSSSSSSSPCPSTDPSKLRSSLHPSVPRPSLLAGSPVRLSGRQIEFRKSDSQADDLYSNFDEILSTVAPSSGSTSRQVSPLSILPSVKSGHSARDRPLSFPQCASASSLQPQPRRVHTPRRPKTSPCDFRTTSRGSSPPFTVAPLSNAYASIDGGAPSSSPLMRTASVDLHVRPSNDSRSVEKVEGESHGRCPRDATKSDIGGQSRKRGDNVSPRGATTSEGYLWPAALVETPSHLEGRPLAERLGILSEQTMGEKENNLNQNTISGSRLPRSPGDRRRTNSFATASAVSSSTFFSPESDGSTYLNSRASPPQLCDGYYLCTPPPMSSPSPSSRRPAKAGRRTTGTTPSEMWPKTPKGGLEPPSSAHAHHQNSTPSPSLVNSSTMMAASTGLPPMAAIPVYPNKEPHSGLQRLKAASGRTRSSSEVARPTLSAHNFPSGDSAVSATSSTSVATKSNDPQIQQDVGPKYGKSSAGTVWKLEQYFMKRSRTDALKGSRVKEVPFHAYNRKVAPYWMSYSDDTLIAEITGHNAVKGVAGLSTTSFPQGPPKRVLDIGTGTGVWCLDIAKEWKESEIVGLDLVPIQTPVDAQAGDGLAGRISWVVANALEGLPFPDNSFDFVHSRFINQGIPEDKWDYILSEMTRVLAPGGRLEAMEYDWSFMGNPREVPTKDLEDLKTGKFRSDKTIFDQIMKRKRLDTSNDDVGKAVERVMNIRFICVSPVSRIPADMISQDVVDFQQGNPRMIPILAESVARASSRQSVERHNTARSSSAAVPTQSSNHVDAVSPRSRESFTLREQIGKPLNPHRFDMSNLEVFRATTIVRQAFAVNDSRSLIWDELEWYRQSDNDSRVSLDRGGEFDDRAWQGRNHPWRCRQDFEKAVDQWYAEMISRADLGSLLTSVLGWRDGGSELTVEGRKTAERQRKMSTSTTTGVPPSLPTSPTESKFEAVAFPMPSSATKDVGLGIYGDHFTSTTGRRGSNDSSSTVGTAGSVDNDHSVSVSNLDNQIDEENEWVEDEGAPSEKRSKSPHHLPRHILRREPSWYDLKKSKGNTSSKPDRRKSSWTALQQYHQGHFPKHVIGNEISSNLTAKMSKRVGANRALLKTAAERVSQSVPNSKTPSPEDEKELSPPLPHQHQSFPRPAEAIPNARSTTKKQSTKIPTTAVLSIPRANVFLARKPVPK